MRKWELIDNGEWFYPTRVGKMKCCNCGLIHNVEFKLLDWVNNDGKIIAMKMTVNREDTASTRRRMKPKKEK